MLAADWQEAGQRRGAFQSSRTNIVTIRRLLYKQAKCLFIQIRTIYIPARKAPVGRQIDAVNTTTGSQNSDW